jgi:hypothetical protein
MRDADLGRVIRIESHFTHVLQLLGDGRYDDLR